MAKIGLRTILRRNKEVTSRCRRMASTTSSGSDTNFGGKSGGGVISRLVWSGIKFMIEAGAPKPHCTMVAEKSCSWLTQGMSPAGVTVILAPSLIST